MFAGNFAPAGWAFCDGQLLAISENETLFQLIGTTYGGDGQSTFAVPDLRGRVPVHIGTGGGISYVIGEMGGVETVTVTPAQLPAHTHPLFGTSYPANKRGPKNALLAATKEPLYGTPGSLTGLGQGTVALAGGSQPHPNMQPYLCVNFIISQFGIFPSPA